MKLYCRGAQLTDDVVDFLTAASGNHLSLSCDRFGDFFDVTGIIRKRHLPTALAGNVLQSVVSVHPFVGPFLFTLSFEPTDLYLNFFHVYAS